jgi:hypothetical protein
MDQILEWLPETITVDGEWQGILFRLYRIFECDFKDTRRVFQALPVRWDTSILPGERYEEGFWHLITRDNHKTRERLFEPKRAERLPWCGPTITNSHHEAVKVWDYNEGKKRVRTYIWLDTRDYAIILERRQTRKRRIAFLITAFHVDGPSRRRSLLRKYENRLS